MKSKILAFLLPAACGAALAITLSVAAAEQPPASSVATSETPSMSPQPYSEYRNDQWHFSFFLPSNITAEATDIPGGVTVQFMEPNGDELFQVSAWRYHDLIVHQDGLQLKTPSLESDQPNELNTVHAYEGDGLRLGFVKNAIGYTVEATDEDATSTLDILKSWEFI